MSKELTWKFKFVWHAAWNIQFSALNWIIFMYKDCVFVVCEVLKSLFNFIVTQFFWNFWKFNLDCLVCLAWTTLITFPLFAHKESYFRTYPSRLLGKPFDDKGSHSWSFFSFPCSSLHKKSIFWCQAYFYGNSFVCSCVGLQVTLASNILNTLGSPIIFVHAWPHPPGQPPHR